MCRRKSHLPNGCDGDGAPESRRLGTSVSEATAGLPRSAGWTGYAPDSAREGTGQTAEHLPGSRQPSGNGELKPLVFSLDASL